MKTSSEKQFNSQTAIGGNDVNVKTNSLYLYIPNFVPCPEEQHFFKESIRKSFTLSFDSWVTDGKPVNTGNEYQLDVGSASIISVPLYIIAAHKKVNVIVPPDPQINSKAQVLIKLT